MRYRHNTYGGGDGMGRTEFKLELKVLGRVRKSEIGAALEAAISEDRQKRQSPE